MMSLCWDVYINLCYSEFVNLASILNDQRFIFVNTKCSSYLGHIISCEGVATDPSKTEKVATPTFMLEVWQFLGFARYQKKIIQNFVHMAQPLNKLTEHSKPFVWMNDCQNAFDELCQCLTSTSILVYSAFSRQFILDKDASNTGIGAFILKYSSDGYEQVIAYRSRLLKKLERQYCVTRRELLEVVTFTYQYQAYLIHDWVEIPFAYRSCSADLAVQLQGT